MPCHNCLDKKSTYASRLGANDRFIFILSHLVPFLILSAHIFLKPNSADEGEHLHQAFMAGSGLKPYHCFLEHHMSVVWYVFSPIALFPGFISKIVFYKSMQMLVLALCMYLLGPSFPGSSRWTTWAFVLFLLFLAPFVDYIDLRPELMAYPFVILVTALILRYPAFSMLSAVLLGALCGLELFVSSRAYAFILFFGVLFLSDPHTLRHKAVFVGAGALVALSVALYLGIANILFFVFEITRSVTPLPFEKLHYNPFLLRFTVVFIPVCMLLQLYGLKRFHLFLFALNVLQILLWFSEKLPYHGQSTALMMMNFVFIFHLLADRSGHST